MKTDTFIGDKCNITLSDFPPLETHVYSPINRTSNPLFPIFVLLPHLPHRTLVCFANTVRTVTESADFGFIPLL